MSASDNAVSPQYRDICKERFALIEKQFDDNHAERNRRFDEVILAIKETANDLKQANKNTKAEVNEVNRLLTKGNGKPSILTQVDLLTKEASNTTWYKRALITAFICLVVFGIEENIRYNNKLKVYTQDILHSITIAGIEREAFPITYIPKEINNTP